MEIILLDEVSMSKLLFLLCTTLLLQSCSALNLIPSQVPASTMTSTSSPTASNTATITLTPTRTTTPTPRNTATLIISEFNTQVVLVTDVVPTVSSFTLTPLAPTGGFETVNLSEGRIFYGICKPNFTKMTVRVQHPEEVRKVYIFFRLESHKKPGETTPWTGSVTANDGSGYFLYTLRANNIPERRNFLKAWVHYQFVAEDSSGEIIGRTQVFTRNLLLEPCR